MEFTTIGFDVYAEHNGRGIHAFPRPAVGGMGLPALGVENYVYVPFLRGDPAKYRGARPMLPASFPVSDATRAAIQAAVREHLAKIDRGEVAT